MLLTAALAVVPAAATTPAFAADVRSHPTVRSDDHPGPPQVTDEQRACMEKKGFGRPGERKPGDQPPSREDMQKRWQDRMQAAKDCGITGFPGPGRHFGGPPMNDQQKKCMADKGFEPGMHHKGDQGQRPSREEMQKRFQDFQNARKDCGLPAFQGFRHGPMGQGPMGHGPGGPMGHGPMQQGGPGPQNAPAPQNGPAEHGGNGGGGGNGGPGGKPA
jgi:hypothetical protein